MSVGTDSLHGILFTFASLASIVLGTILFKVLAPQGSLWIGNGVQNLSAGIVLLPFAMSFSSLDDIVPSAHLLGAFAFLVLGGSILAYRLWFHLLRVCGATAAERVDNAPVRSMDAVRRSTVQVASVPTDEIALIGHDSRSSSVIRCWQLS